MPRSKKVEIPATPARCVRMRDKFAMDRLIRAAPPLLAPPVVRLVLLTLLASMSADGSIPERYARTRDEFAQACGFAPSSHRTVNHALKYLTTVGLLRLVAGGGRGNRARYETCMPLEGPFADWLPTERRVHAGLLRKCDLDVATDPANNASVGDPQPLTGDVVVAPLSSVHTSYSSSSSPTTGTEPPTSTATPQPRKPRHRAWSESEQQRSDALLGDIGRHLTPPERRLLNEHLDSFRAETALRKMLLQIYDAGLWTSALRVIVEPADRLNGEVVAYGEFADNAVAVLYSRLKRFSRASQIHSVAPPCPDKVQAVQTALDNLSQRLGLRCDSNSASGGAR